jgi:hypothetical protein
MRIVGFFIKIRNFKGKSDSIFTTFFNDSFCSFILNESITLFTRVTAVIVVFSVILGKNTAVRKVQPISQDSLPQSSETHKSKSID